jgi:hypothetical protein
MPMLVLLADLSAVEDGALRANLLKVGPGQYVGTLDTKRLKDLHDWLQSSGRSATLIAQSRRAPLGFRIQTYGEQGRHWVVTQIDGIPLIGKVSIKTNR